mgnify:CR=1 FL=1
MQAFTTLTGLVAPLDRVNVDTDQIIPKQFLKSIARTGFGPQLFFDWRYLPDGTPRPDFPLNFPAYQGAQIILAGDNFGCGSSREHAPWALEQFGFRALIAPSFALSLLKSQSSSFVWRADPNPANCRIVQGLPRYIVDWTPRV